MSCNYHLLFLFVSSCFYHNEFPEGPTYPNHFSPTIENWESKNPAKETCIHFSQQNNLLQGQKAFAFVWLDIIGLGYGVRFELLFYRFI